MLTQSSAEEDAAAQLPQLLFYVAGPLSFVLIPAIACLIVLPKFAVGFKDTNGIEDAGWSQSQSSSGCMRAMLERVTDVKSP